MSDWASNHFSAGQYSVLLWKIINYSAGDLFIIPGIVVYFPLETIHYPAGKLFINPRIFYHILWEIIHFPVDIVNFPWKFVIFPWEFIIFCKAFILNHHNKMLYACYDLWGLLQETDRIQTTANQDISGPRVRNPSTDITAKQNRASP